MQKSEFLRITPDNLYIHIPFCKSKCHYCNFISFANKNEFIEPYFAALKKELEHYFKNYTGVKLETIYIGGGTPSVVDFAFYKDIFKLLADLTEISKNAEITMEINPGAVNFNYLKNLRSLGINRLSIGVQSFDDRLLKIINRAHSAKDAVETVKIAKKAGFENISIDLIYGLPCEAGAYAQKGNDEFSLQGRAHSFQTSENWEESLKQALSLDINHISTYGLKIEENTEFSVNPPENIPDDELQSQIYLKTIEILEKNNFNHYEISNFCKSGFESRHNKAYWQNKEYFGFGLAAHGYLEGTRYSNTENLEKYIINPIERAFENKVSETAKLEEAIFLGLRLTNGINSQEFKIKYGVDIFQQYSKIIGKYLNYDLMVYENGNLKLTKNGILLSNSIFADFLE